MVAFVQDTTKMSNVDQSVKNWRSSDDLGKKEKLSEFMNNVDQKYKYAQNDLFERSEFLIATCKKKKLTVCLMYNVRIISWF